MELSISDLSKLLGVVPDTILRWVRQGKLPVSRKGRIYQFHTKNLEKWAAARNITLNFPGTDKTESSKGQGEVDIIALSTAVENGGIIFDVEGDDVESVLDAAVKKMPALPADRRSDLLASLIKREEALSTGIGNGIAIPHPREQLSYIETPMVCIAFLKDPVEYKALDQKPVSILFFILSPSLKLHLHLLSSLSFCLRDFDFVTFLKSKPDPDQIIEKFEQFQHANPL